MGYVWDGWDGYLYVCVYVCMYVCMDILILLLLLCLLWSPSKVSLSMYLYTGREEGKGRKVKGRVVQENGIRWYELAGRGWDLVQHLR